MWSLGRYSKIAAGLLTSLTVFAFLVAAGNRLAIADAGGQRLSNTATIAAQTATTQLVGFVYDKDSRPGEQVSASVVTNPKDYGKSPDLGVIEIQVPIGPTGSAQATLQGLVVDLGDGRQQDAEQPVTVRIPAGAAAISARLGPRDAPTSGVQTQILLQQPATSIAQPSAAPSVGAVLNSGRANDFMTPPVWQNTGAISGPFSGNAQTTHVTVDGRAARILTETPRRAHVDNAAGAPGAHAVMLEDGPRGAFFPSVVNPRVTLTAGRLELLKGQRTSWTAVVDLPVPDSAWQRGGAVPGATDLSTTMKLFPGFHVPRPGEPAAALLWITNGSPDTISFQPSRNGVYARALNRRDFRNGTWTLPDRGVIQSQKSGRFALNAFLEAYFAPLGGQEPPGNRLTDSGRGVIGGPPDKPGTTQVIKIKGWDADKKTTVSSVEIADDQNACKIQHCGDIKTVGGTGKNKENIFCEDAPGCGGKDCPASHCKMMEAWSDPKNKDIPKNTPHPEQLKFIEGKNTGGSGVAPKDAKQDAKESASFPPDKGRIYACGCK